MTYSNPNRPLTYQVTVSVLLLTLLSAAMVLGYGYFTTVHADRDFLQKQKHFVATGIRAQIEGLAKEQESVTVWDDAVLLAKAGDHRWMGENLSVWMHDYYGHDRVYVLSEKDSVVHAMRDGEIVAPGEYEADREAAAPLVEKLRQMMSEAAAADPEDGARRMIVQEVVTSGGWPAIASVMPIVPSSDRVVQEPGTEYLHVTIQYLDADLATRIASPYQLARANIMPGATPPPGAAAMPIQDSGGRILGFLTWQADRPGLQLLRETMPALLLQGAIIAAVLVFLLRRLRQALTQLQVSRNEAQFLAFHDRLTGLPNRALFDDRLSQALAHARREGGRLALLYLDLDRFKNVNDTLGHPAGDELVRQAGARLVAAVRETDTVARLGGDEFAIIMAGISDGRTAEDLCERLLGELSRPFVISGSQVFVGASIGVALSGGSEPEPGELLRRADIALYEAKNHSKGRYRLFAGDMDDIVRHKREIEADLRSALEAGRELWVAYQPIFAPDGVTIAGAEALVRWQHPRRGELTPQQFLRVAEERGLIGQLGAWVLLEAARFAASTSLPWVAVNISPLQLKDDIFVDLVLAILDEAGLSPERLQMEIVETTLLEGDPASKTALARVRDSGIRIALDDFGRGSSALDLLRRREIDKLKIDRSFVDGLGVETNASAVVRALVDLARAFNVVATVEGIETTRQKNMLVEIGCQELQGVLLARPMSAERLLARFPEIGETEQKAVPVRA